MTTETPSLVDNLARATRILEDTAIPAGTLYTRLQHLEASRRCAVETLRDGGNVTSINRQLAADLSNVQIALDALRGYRGE